MEQLYNKYINIQKFIECRKYKLFDDTFLDYENFRNKIQHMSYIFHKLKDRNNQEIDIYLFEPDSKYVKSTNEFNKLLYRYKNPTNIIFFTKEKLSTYLLKAMRKYSDLNIENYLHKHFIIEINKGPLCAKHTVLSVDEAREVCFSLMAHGHKLPSIAIDDPQNIWIGGQVNDIIKIEANSELTGKTIRYRIVTPVSGKVEQLTVVSNKNNTNNIIKDKDDNKTETESPFIEENYEDYEDYEE